MDWSDISISGNQNAAKMRKRRHRKVKISKSNLSERLNPDFDPIDAISKNSYAPTPNDDEKIARDMDLNSLIKFRPKILDNLPKILTFLQSGQKELCFPNLTPFEKDFLVQIARNNSLLNIIDCDEGSLRTAKQILDTVEECKNEYKWIHMFEDRDINENVLVYKKLNVEQMQQTQDNVSCSTPPNPSSIASDLEKMTITQGQQMPPSFKTMMLNMTLRFIKDPNRLTLKYPIMSLALGDYLYNLIMLANHDGNLGFGFKSLYSSLYETFECLKEKYEFKVTFNNVDRYTTRLILNKIPKTGEVDLSENNSKNNSTDLNSSTSSPKSKDLLITPKVLSKLKTVEKVPETYIKDSLQKFLEFVEDKSMASLEFKNVEVEQSNFLQRLIAMSRSEENHKLFSSECGALLKRVVRAVKRREWNLRLDFSKLDRRTGLRTIMFYKTPSFGATAETLRPPKTQTSKGSYSSGVKQVKTLQITIDKERNSGHRQVEGSYKMVTEESDGRVCRSDEERKSEGMEQKNGGDNLADLKNQSSSHKKPAIAFQSAGSLTMDDVTQQGNKMAATRADSPPPASRKGRLLKALNKPMESDRAERMMRMMGWEGGALGVRGEGITEPILPALHISAGAGLGHIKQPNHSTAEYRLKFLRGLYSFVTTSDVTALSFSQPMSAREGRFIKTAVGAFNDRKTIGKRNPGHIKQTNHSTAEYRLKFLHGLYSFVTTSDVTALSFSQPMSAREGRFIKTAVGAFNDKKRIGLSDSEELQLVKEITAEMMNNPELRIGFQISEDKKELHLTKSLDTPFVQKTTKKKKKSKPKQNNSNDVTIDNDVIDICETTKNIENICPTKKAAQKLAYKIKYLECVKDFLTQDNDFADYKFDIVLNKKQKIYMQNVITDINKGVLTTRFFSEIENDLFINIRKITYGCYMSVTFDKRAFKLHKKFPKKNSTNPEVELPPPKSKDLKNTIIYQNDIPILAELYENLIKNTANNIDNVANDLEVSQSVNNDHYDISPGDSDDNCDDHDRDPDYVSDPDLISYDRDQNFYYYDDYLGDRGGNRDDPDQDDYSDDRDVICDDHDNYLDERRDDSNVVCDDHGDYRDNQSIKHDMADHYNNTPRDKSISSNDNDTNFINDDDNKSMSISPKSADTNRHNENITSKDINLLSYKETIFKNSDILNLDDISPDISSSTDDETQLIIDDKHNIVINDDKDSDDSDVMIIDCNTSKDTIDLNSSNKSLKSDKLEREKDNVSTKSNSSDIKYDKFESDLNSEVNNNLINVNSDTKNHIETELEKRSYINEKVVENNCHSSPNKRGSIPDDAQNDQPKPKRNKFLKYVSILSVHEKDISIDLAKLVQKAMSEFINEKVFLPLLKCHGIKDGGLVYSCHSEGSYDWLKTVLSVVSVASDIKLSETDFSENIFKLSLKINSFIEEKAGNVFNKLKLYNPELNTDNWVVLDESFNENFAQYDVQVDEYTFKVISENGFSLFAGVDKAQFSIFWD